MYVPISTTTYLVNFVVVVVVVSYSYQVKGESILRTQGNEATN